jgi:hypothetical protein
VSIVGDGSGYYLYLPATFIYQDFSYQFARNPELNNAYYGEPAVAIDELENGKFFNRYYYGTSILMLPFFVLACIMAWVAGFPIDGYSLPFQVFMTLSAISYFLAGLEFLRRTLLQLQLSPVSVFATIISIAIGTNLTTYVWNYPSFSHVYVFFLVSAMLYLAQQFGKNQLFKPLLLLILVVGLTFVTRPTSILAVLVLPMFWGTSIKSTLAGFKRNGIAIFVGFLGVFLFVFLQLLFYRVQLGGWELWSYKTAWFDFLNPHWFEFMFGYRKGLFVYSPLLLFAIPGLMVLYKSNKVGAILIALIIGLASYVLSSWSQWWFGGGFGSRSMIDFYPLFAIGMAFFFDKAFKQKLGVTLALPLLALIGINLVMNYQLRHNILAFDKMNSDKFWQIFMETDPVFAFSCYEPEKFVDSVNYVQSSRLSEIDQSIKPFQIETPQSHYDPNDKSIKVDNVHSFGNMIKIPANSCLSQDHKTTFTFKSDIFLGVNSSSGVVVSALQGKDEWRAIKLNRSVRSAQSWTPIEVEFPAFNTVEMSDTLVFYVLNTEPEPVWVKNGEVEFHQHK